MNYIKKIRQIKEKILNEQFFRPCWYSIFLNPYFINRYSLYKEIKRFAKTTSRNTRVLDVGCGIKPYRNLFITNDYVGIDIQGGGHADEAKAVDTFYDGVNIPFQEDSFDSIICTQVLEHSSDPEMLVKEMSRVIRPGGRIFISMPFIYPEHEAPFDFRRFTKFEHKKILEKNNFININIIKTTGFFGTFGQLFVIFLFEGIGFRASILKILLSIFVFAPIQTIALLLDMITRKSGSTMDYVVNAKKI
jgi:SAM-dependent methyltransferase